MGFIRSQINMILSGVPQALVYHEDIWYDLEMESFWLASMFLFSLL